MSGSTTTTKLLIGLGDPANSRMWTDFCSRYRPILIAFGRRLGLREHDAQDVAQESLMTFAVAYRRGQYDRAKGRLRTWLFTIARHKVCDWQRRLPKEELLAGASDQTGPLQCIPDKHGMNEIWEAEWQRAILKACIEAVRRQVKPSSLQVFELYVLKQRALDEVAAELGMSKDAVVRAKARVLTRIRAVRARLESQW